MFQFGLLGLMEEEWIDTLATVDPEDITFIDYVEEGRLLARYLKDQVSLTTCVLQCLKNKVAFCTISTLY